MLETNRNIEKEIENIKELVITKIDSLNDQFN